VGGGRAHLLAGCCYVKNIAGQPLGTKEGERRTRALLVNLRLVVYRLDWFRVYDITKK